MGGPGIKDGARLVPNEHLVAYLKTIPFWSDEKINRFFKAPYVVAIRHRFPDKGYWRIKADGYDVTVPYSLIEQMEFVGYEPFNFSYGHPTSPQPNDPRFYYCQDAIDAAQEHQSKQGWDGILAVWENDTGEMKAIIVNGQVFLPN